MCNKNISQTSVGSMMAQDLGGKKQIKGKRKETEGFFVGGNGKGLDIHQGLGYWSLCFNSKNISK